MKKTTFDPSAMTLLVCIDCGIPFAILTLTWRMTALKKNVVKCPCCGQYGSHLTADEVLSGRVSINRTESDYSVTRN